MSSLPLPSVEVVQALTAIDRLRLVAARLDFRTFPMRVTVKIEDTPTRSLYADRGMPDMGLVQIVVTTYTNPRPVDGRIIPREDDFGIVFDKGVEHYLLAKMDEREMAMLVREHIVLAIVHEIDEHLLIDHSRLVETHPDGTDSFIEGPVPREVWRGRRLSSSR